jgi:hypothetical protein
MNKIINGHAHAESAEQQLSSIRALNQRRIQKTRLPGKEGSNVAGEENTLLLKEPVFPLSADEHIMKSFVFIVCFALVFFV